MAQNSSLTPNKEISTQKCQWHSVKKLKYNPTKPSSKEKSFQKIEHYAIICNSSPNNIYILQLKIHYLKYLLTCMMRLKLYRICWQSLKLCKFIYSFNQ